MTLFNLYLRKSTTSNVPNISSFVVRVLGFASSAEPKINTYNSCAVWRRLHLIIERGSPKAMKLPDSAEPSKGGGDFKLAMIQSSHRFGLAGSSPNLSESSLVGGPESRSHLIFRLYQFRSQEGGGALS